VVQHNQVLGLITIHDIKKVPREQWPTKTLREAMTPFANLKSVGPDEDLSTVLRILTEQNINQLPVVQDGNIIGMIARDNLLAFISVHSELGK